MRYFWIPLASLLCALPARAGDLVDVRVSYTIGDDDFLHDTAELPQVSPTVDVGDRSPYQLFFENLNTRVAGRENELHLVLYQRTPAYFPRLHTEAGAVLRLDTAELGSDNARLSRVLRDDGTYLRLIRDLPDGQADVTLYPFSTSRFRLGYLYALTWGGDEIFPERQGPARGLRLALRTGPARAFLGLKTARVQTLGRSGRTFTGETVEVSHPETFYGLLGGGGFSAGPLSLDAGGGFFQMGENPLPDVRGEPMDAAGASARLAWSDGMPVGLSVDLQLYRTDAEFLEGLHRRESYPGGFDWQVSLEGSYIVQTLQDPDRTGSTTRQPAPAGALQFRSRLDHWRFNVTGVMRSLEFMFHTLPSFPPFQAIPDAAEVETELFAAAAVDHHFPALRLTPGLQGGVQRPATLTTRTELQTTGANPPDTDTGRQTLILRADRSFTILPRGEQAVPIFAGKLTVKWDVSDMMSLIAMVFATYDENLLRHEVNEFGLTERSLLPDPLTLGAAMVAQARF